MALKLRNRVKENTSAGGTGAFQLSGVPDASFFTFISKVGNGNTCPYVAEYAAANQVEWGIGTVASGTPNTVTRTTVKGGSNGTSAVNFSGNPVVRLDRPAEMDPEAVGTAGLIPFRTTEGLYDEDAALKWDDTNLALVVDGYFMNDGTNFSSFKKTGGAGLLLDGISGGDIEWFTASFGAGYGFRLTAADVGGGTEFSLSGRNNSATWTKHFRVSDIGAVNLGHNKWLGWRNGADSADVNGLRLDTSNRLEFGPQLFHDDLSGWAPTGTGIIAASKNWSGNPAAGAYEAALNIKAVSRGMGASLAEGRLGAQYEWADGSSTNQQITSATNATPIVITTVANHGLADGERVCITGITGNTNANGLRFVDVLSATTFGLYSDVGLTTPIAGNGTYTPLTVNGATNATPIVIATSAAHGLVVGDIVSVWNVGGNTAANGLWAVKEVVDTTHFSIQRRDKLDVTGNGAYTSGGSAGKGWVTNQSFGFCAFYRVNPFAGNHRGGTDYPNIDDLNGLAVMNVGSAMATDAFYLARNTQLTYEWWTSMSLDANSLWGIRLGGSYFYTGLDLHGTFTAGVIDMRNATLGGTAFGIGLGNSHQIVARNNANTSDLPLAKLNTSDVFEFAGGAIFAGAGTSGSVGFGGTPTAGKVHAVMGTQTSAGDAYAVTAAWNNAAVTFNSYRAFVYDQASKKDSNFFDALLSTNGTDFFSKFKVDKQGNVFANGYVGNTLKQVRYQPSPGTTTILGIGDTAATANGTPTWENNAKGGWLNYVHAATTAGSKAGWTRVIATHGCTMQQFNPVETISVSTTATAADIAGCVWHLGLYSADPTNTTPATATGDFAAFMFNPAGSAFLQCVSRDNTTTETTVTTVTVAVSSRYYLRIDMNSGVDIKFYINNILVATHATRLPRSTVALNRYDMSVITVAGAGTARRILINLVQGEQE